MKKYFILVLTIFMLLTGCDFISKDNDGQNKNSNAKISIKFDSNGETKKATFDKYLKYFIDSSGSIVALLGLLLTLPLIRKKLIENHITNALNEIQKTNIKVLEHNQKLIDIYLPHTYNDYPLSKKEIEKVLKDLKEVFYLSQSGSSDVTSVLFYLKATIQGALKHFDSKPLLLIAARDIYGLTINTLELVNFYCTQVVQIPKSVKIINLNIINKKIRKYISYKEYKKYKHFNQGIIHNPNSSHFTLFYSKISKCSCPLIIRAAFQTYCNTGPILKDIFLNRIYAPLDLEKTEKRLSPFGITSYKVYLIGVKFKNQIDLISGKTIETVDLIYSNPDDFHLFASNLRLEQLNNGFKDSFISDSKFELEQAKKMSHACIETFTLQFDKDYLEKCFKKNKSKMKRKMKII